MLELRFPPLLLLEDRHIAAARRAIADALAAQQTLGNRGGNQAIVDQIGLDCSFEKDEGYHGEALDYHLGLLCAHVGEPQQAALHIERSGTLPASGGDRIFSDHQRESIELRRRQELAKQRGIPSFIIASMPRSASASLTQTLATLLDAPIMRVSCGHHCSFYLMPRWLNAFTPGGAVLHDHFGAEPFNLAALRDGGVRRVFVRARDPRPAACSAVTMTQRKFVAVDPSKFEANVIAMYERYFIPWLSGWLAAAAETTGPLDVRWLLHGPGHPPIGETVRQLLAIHAADHPALEPYAKAAIAEVSANFVTGDDNAWRARISADGQERLWQATPEPVRALLQLRR